jgi:hypothetical protein
MCFSSSNQFITQIPAWFLIIAGWFAVHYFAKEREQRKEARERLDQFILALLAIEEKAIQFHQSDTYKGDMARTLVFDIQRFIARLKRHPFGKFEVDPNLLKELRRAVTLRNFDSSKFACQPANSAILGNLANAVDDIEDQLEREYERIYL